MKILFAVGGYWPSTGGVQIVTQYMAEGLVKRGHDVSVVTTLLENTVREEQHNGVRVYRFVKKDFLKYHYGEKKEYQKFLLEHKNEIDAIIIVCSNNYVAQWFYPIIDEFQCRKIMYQHGMYDGKFHFREVHSISRFVKQLLLTPYWEVYHRYYWRKIMKFDACVHLFEGDSSHQYFKEHGFKNNVVIMNSCEQSLFEAPTKEDIKLVQNFGIEKNYFIYVGNYCARKDQKLALRSFYALENEDAELVLIGSKENGYFDELKQLDKQLVKQYPVHGKVHILAGITREDTIALIKKSYACLMSSNNEFLPITIIEAMACGHPFISTNVGVVSKLPGGVIASESEDLVYWMTYYLRYPKFVEQMGEIAHNYVRDNMYLEDKVKQLELLLKK